MNEIREYNEPVLDSLGPPDDVLITQPTTGALQRMEAEARAMKTAYTIASSLSKTEMVPEAYQAGKHGESAAYNLCAAIMYGAELGLSAVQSAQNIFIVRGKPAIYSVTMAAVIRRAGFVIEEVEATDEKVVWKGLRDGAWAFSEWTIGRAKLAGYTSNKLYETNPKAMLRAKCIAELARIKFQDCITGLAHSIEELQLENVTVQRVVKPANVVRGAAALRQAAAASQAPEQPVEEPEVTPEPVEQWMISKMQVDKIRKLYLQKGIKGQGVMDDVAEFLQLDSPLKDLNDLSLEDGDAVLAYLS